LIFYKKLLFIIADVFCGFYLFHVSLMKKDRSCRLMLWLAILIIICGIITILNPSKFWGIVNILLGISLIFSWLSAIINAIKNSKTQYISFLFVIWILAVILWCLLIWAKEANFVGKLMVWMFALWAFMRWGMLIFFWIQNRENMPLWWWISILWWILMLLAILTAISSASMANLVGICIWISFIFDGVSLLFFSLRWNNQNIQIQVIEQSSQNEIAQWDILVWDTADPNDNIHS